MSEDARRARGAEVEAQAKINLRLRILAREASGFHQLETLFLRIALADRVRVHRAATRSLDVAGLAPDATLGPMEQNLAWRAATAYADAAGWRDGFAIELEKRIPVGGGLGGGSADAGAVLRALDALAPAPLGETALMRIAASLGADVPFLASEHAYALAWGRGERMLALVAPESRPVVLVVPPFAVNTAAAYGWLADARAAQGAAPTAGPALAPAALADWDALAAQAVNDFEPVVAARHPEIGAIVTALRDIGCAPAMMSGSGSTLFGVCPRGVQHEVAVEGGRNILTRTVTTVAPVRPLH